jgi:hypothetical protein
LYWKASALWFNRPAARAHEFTTAFAASPLDGDDIRRKKADDSTQQNAEAVPRPDQDARIGRPAVRTGWTKEQVHIAFFRGPCVIVQITYRLRQPRFGLSKS